MLPASVSLQVAVDVQQPPATPVHPGPQEPAVTPSIHPFALRRRAVRILQPAGPVPRASPPLAGVCVAAGELEAAVAVGHLLVGGQLAPVVAAVHLPTPHQALQ
jgi:hypothetical protein